VGDRTADEEMRRRRTSWDGIDQAEATRRLETAQLPADEGPAPRAVAGGGGGFKLMDVPEGAQIRRTVSMQGEDGSKDQTVASWIHSPAKPAALEQPGRFERLERQKVGMGGSQEARERRLQTTDRMRMMDAGRQDKMAGDDANRLTQETLEAIKAGSQVAGNQAKAKTDLGVATINADAASAGREQTAFFKGIDQAGKQRDDARSDEQLGLNREQLGMQQGRDKRDQAWEQSIRDRVDADVKAGQQSGQPVETWKDPISGRQFYRSWGDVDPKTGEKTGWKPVSTDMMAGLGTGAAAATTNTAGKQPAAGAPGEATAPLKRKTADGRVALYDPNTKAFIGYDR
jgi:hypothetical protein